MYEDLYILRAKCFGKNIRTWRKKNGKTQVDLALELCITREAVSKWERGCCMPDWPVFFMLAEVTGLSAGALLSEDELM